MQSSHHRKRRRVRTLSVATLLSAGLAGNYGLAYAQQEPGNDGQASGKKAATSIGQVQDVVVTTGVRGEQRTVADSPAPIDVISGDQLQHTGRAELSEALARLLPSFNFGTNIAGVNSVIRPVSNRGLGPGACIHTGAGQRQAAPQFGAADQRRRRQQWRQCGRPRHHSAVSGRSY